MEQSVSTCCEETHGQSIRAKTMTRWKASAIHLSICAVIGLSVLAWMLLVWYPAPYFEGLGAGKLSMTIIGVDVVIGPLITLIIYNPLKKSLRFDLAVVALLQLSALAYGVYVVYEARPVYVVFNVDRFDVVAANEIDPAEREKVSRPEYQSLPLTGPILVAAVLPSDREERHRILFAAVGAGYDLPNFPQHYVPYEEQMSQAIARSRPLDDLAQQRAEAEPQLAALKKELGGRANDLGFLPVRARKLDLTAIIDRKTGEVLKVLAIDPWV